MKRSALLRKTALRRSKFMSRNRETKQQQREGDPVYLDWIRALHCCSCGAKPPSHPHHSTGGGMGQKSGDRETMPLCFRCHRDFHDGNGKFDGWTKAQRRLFQDLAVERYQRISASLAAECPPSHPGKTS